MEKVKLAEMTQAEVREMIPRRPIVLAPLGSLEDQGPHTFMGDHILAGRIAELAAEAARKAGVEVYVAPTFPFGCDDYFGASPGGVALSPETFKRVIREMFEAWLGHGLDRIVVINGHGGNVPALHEVGSAIRRAHGVLIPSLYIWKIAHFLQVEIVGREVAMQSAGHGANPMGSVAMHLFPDQMRPDLIPDPTPFSAVLGLAGTNFGTVRFENVEVEVPVDYDAIAANGVFGADPRAISAELGGSTVDSLVGLITRFLVHFDLQTSAKTA